MCLNNTFYPLVKLKNGKQKIIMQCSVKINNRDNFNDLKELNKNLQFARIGQSKFIELNKVFEDNNVSEVVKMVQVPCGCCRECLNDISRQWAFRIMKEASKYENNYFITFTIDDDHMTDRNLNPLFFQEFNKKLKIYLKRKGCKSDFRFYGVGEYGSLNVRKHYHCIYFNLEIPDLKFVNIDNNKNLHFKSDFLNDVYNNQGFIDISGVDIGSACYVARYCDKKKRLTKEQKLDLIKQGIVPEFSAMSRRPGIGAEFLDTALEDFKQGITKHYIKGKSFSLPLYYNKKIKEIMKDTPELKAYEEQARINMYTKVACQLEISDFLGDLDEVNAFSDVVNKRGNL